jgi:hypothetical protein
MRLPASLDIYLNLKLGESSGSAAPFLLLRWQPLIGCFGVAGVTGQLPVSLMLATVPGDPGSLQEQLQVSWALKAIGGWWLEVVREWLTFWLGRWGVVWFCIAVSPKFAAGWWPCGQASTSALRRRQGPYFLIFISKLISKAVGSLVL